MLNLLADFISFPKLGIELPISDTLVQFKLFGVEFTIKWYGVMIALGFLLAILYATKRCASFGIDADRMIDVALITTVLAFVGARLYYVLFSEDRAAYFEDPVTILQIWKGGLGIYGGLITAFLTGLWMCRLRKINTLAMFDLASLGFLIGQCIGRWGNFFNQEAFGGNTDLPWGMSGSAIEQGLHGSGFDASLPVHPTFLYESLWCLLGFVLLHLLSKKAYRFKGQIFSLYLIWYGVGRFAIESLRTDSLYWGTMRISQLVAVVTVLGGLALYLILRARSQETRKDLFAAETAGAADGEGKEPVTEETEGKETLAEETAAEESSLEETAVEETAVAEAAVTADDESAAKEEA